MAKITSKNGIIVVGGYVLTPNLFNYEVNGPRADPIDVTGFAEGSQNFIPGQVKGENHC